MNRGFTLIELMVSLGIFVVMTTLVMAKYGIFNQSTMLTNTAYDIALIIRQAQSYGLSVKSVGSGSGLSFMVPYGVNFSNAQGGNACGPSSSSNRTSLVFFADTDPFANPDKQCTGGDSVVKVYKLTRGAVVSSLCVGNDQISCRDTGVVNHLTVSYMRPNPEANICGGSTSCDHLYGEVTIRGSDGSTRTVVLRQNGQISVERQSQ